MSWDWKAHADAVNAAHGELAARGQPGHAEAAARFHSAIEAAWPPGFFEQLERCKQGDPSGLDAVLDFLEACPYFFRSGYIQGKALAYALRPSRTPAQDERLRAIVHGAVTGRLWLPFRRIPTIARAVDAPGMRAELQRLLEHPKLRVRANAARVLEHLQSA
ncbi:MAG: hypothetical protein JST54_08830 [Deltaproteobacteria bacterium]|nr:hypothetical protein [Deltaproteobacteria bacterium]